MDIEQIRSVLTTIKIATIVAIFIQIGSEMYFRTLQEHALIIK